MNFQRVAINDTDLSDEIIGDHARCAHMDEVLRNARPLIASVQ
jgi:hypothetical protein